jgi:hypothetical protein
LLSSAIHVDPFSLQAFPEESSPVGPAADVAQVGVDAVHRRRAERQQYQVRTVNVSLAELPGGDTVVRCWKNTEKLFFLSKALIGFHLLASLFNSKIVLIFPSFYVRKNKR